MNQPEELNQPEALFPEPEHDAFERELAQALRPVAPPDGFAQRVMLRAQASEFALPTPARAKILTMPRPRLWAGGALAASLLAGAFVTQQTHIRRQRRQEELAQRQFEAAIRITDETLEQTRLQLQQAGRPARQLTEFIQQDKIHAASSKIEQDRNQERVMTKTTKTKLTKTTKTTMQMVLAMAVLAASTANAKQLKLKLKTEAQPDAAVASLAMQVANVSMAAAPQVKDELFAGTDKFAQGASSVTEINLDPRTMGMVTHSTRDRSLASKMNFMVVHKYQYEKPGMYSMDDVEAYRKKLTDGSWACPIRVRTKTSSTDICSRTASDNETNEMVILTAQPRELTFIHMSGKMSLDELNRMSEGPDEIHLHTPPEPPEPKMKLYLSPSPSPSPSPAPLPTPQPPH